MFNMERPLPVGLFQTVQAFAVNCYNLLQCSLFHSKQPTCSPTVNLVSEWALWCINHHLKGPQNPLNAEWVQPLEYLSTSSPFFWDMPIETKKTSIKWFPKIWVLKDLGSVIKESFHDVLSVQHINPPTPDTNLLKLNGWFCWSPGWIPYQRRKPQKFQILTTYRLSDVFFFQWPKVPSTIQLVLQHPGVETMAFCFGRFLHHSFPSTNIFIKYFIKYFSIAIF